MTDIELRYRKNGVEIYLITEVFANGPLYIMTVTHGPSKTKDTFKTFKEAFDSFTGIVNTLEKEI